MVFNLSITTATGSTGTIGGKRSDEFHLASEIGEDNVIHCHGCGEAFNEELMTSCKEQNVVSASGSGGSTTVSSSSPTCIKCGSSDLSSSKSIEVS